MVPGLRHCRALPGLAAVSRSFRVRSGGSGEHRCAQQALILHLDWHLIYNLTYGWGYAVLRCLPNLASFRLAFLSLFLFLSPFPLITSLSPYKIVVFLQDTRAISVPHV